MFDGGRVRGQPHRNHIHPPHRIFQGVCVHIGVYGIQQPGLFARCYTGERIFCHLPCPDLNEYQGIRVLCDDVDFSAWAAPVERDDAVTLCFQKMACCFFSPLPTLLVSLPVAITCPCCCHTLAAPPQIVYIILHCA